MKRDIIKIEENAIRVTGCDVWMSEPELVELFGTTAGAVGSEIKSVLKEEALNAYEVCKCVRRLAAIVRTCTAWRLSSPSRSG